MIPPPAPNPIIWISQIIRPLLPQIAVAITSTALALFGSEMNSSFRTLIRKQPFIVRVFAFVMLVAFGYGVLNLAISQLISRMLMQADDLLLSPIVTIVFIAIGILAEARRQI